MRKIFIPVGFVHAVGWSALVVALAEALRHSWIESTRFAFRCVGDNWPWWCALRTVSIVIMHSGLIGYLSVMAGAWAVLRRSTAGAYLALLAGAAGLVLYNYEFSAVGFLLGLLVLWRRACQQHAEGKQRT